ncbi:MAG: DUF1634 domain-containing protein [Chlorobaculum sp.]|jgi:hypothetical protein|nr:DUF1634 domain-containing protein [Chlorobaculum sp.]
MKQETVHADKVQLAYAGILSKATTLGMILVAIGYIVYVFQLLPLSVPIDQVAGNWGLRASEFHQKVPGAPSGWSCFSHAGQGDMLSYISIIYLGIVTMMCLVAAGFAFLREKNMIYTLVSFAQIAVLILAAAGVVSGGH